MSKTVKVLIVGSVKGDFATTFAKVKAAHEKAKLDVVFCLGSFWGTQSTKEEQIQQLQETTPDLAIPVYFTDDQTPKRGTITNNLICLGNDGLMEINDGLKVAYIFNTALSSVDSITKLAEQGSGNKVDIFLSNDWPQNVLENVPENLKFKGTFSDSPIVAKICSQLAPRYIFVPASAYYERPPFSQNNTFTRFYALADISNVDKQKNLYAVSLQPKAITPAPTGVTTPSPFDAKRAAPEIPKTEPSTKKQKTEEPVSSSYNRWAAEVSSAKGQPKIQKNPAVCWFCLSEAEAELHLVVSVAQEAYLALAKGGINSDHVIIVPIAHIENLGDASVVLLKEIQNYKESLRKFFASQNKSTIFFERNIHDRRFPIHNHVQAIAVPHSLVETAKTMFQDEGKKIGLNFQTVPEDIPFNRVVGPLPYFLVEFDNLRLHAPWNQDRFPMQFGRQVLADLLKANADWRTSALSKEQEASAAKSFKAAFNAYDFALIK